MLPAFCFVMLTSHPVRHTADCFNFWLQDLDDPSYAAQLEEIGLADSMVMEEKTETPPQKSEEEKNGEDYWKKKMELREQELRLRDPELAAEDEERLENEAVGAKDLAESSALLWRVVERHDRGLRPFQLEDPDPSMMQLVPFEPAQPAKPAEPAKSKEVVARGRKPKGMNVNSPKKRPSAKASARNQKKKQHDGKNNQKTKKGKKQTRDAKKAKRTGKGKKEDTQTEAKEMRKRLHSAIWLHCKFHFS